MATDSRLNRVQDRVLRAGARAVLLSPGDDILYTLGYTPPGDERCCFLVIGADRAALVVPGVNAHDADLHLAGMPVTLFDYADDAGPAAALQQALETATGSAAGGRLLISDAARHDHVVAVERAVAPDEIDLASRVMRPLRMVKDAEEIELLRRSSHAADETFKAGVAAIAAGVTERQVHDAMLQSFRRLGSDGPSSQLIAFGPNSAAPHHRPDDTVIGTGSMWLDLGCRKRGYCSDLTRMAYRGTPDPFYLEIHQIVWEARQAGEEAARAGNPASAVDRAARSVIEKAGYGEYFVHRTGHGIGVAGHEAPFMMEGDETILEPGMSFSIEPGIYLPGRFGVRIEDIAVVTDGAAEILSELSPEPVIVPE